MLDDKTLELAKGPNFAVLATLMPDGVPQVHVMWVDTDKDHILINTEVHRAKFRNLMANPTATITIMSRDNPYEFVEVRGKVVESVTGPTARSHIDALALKYMGLEEYPNPITSERVILKIRPNRIFGYLPH